MNKLQQVEAENRRKDKCERSVQLFSWLELELKHHMVSEMCFHTFNLHAPVQGRSYSLSERLRTKLELHSMKHSEK